MSDYIPKNPVPPPPPRPGTEQSSQRQPAPQSPPPSAAPHTAAPSSSTGGAGPTTWEKSYEQDEMPAGPVGRSTPQTGVNRPVASRGTPVAKGPSTISALPETVFRGVDDTLHKLLGEHAATFRSNKPLLFGAAGFLGAAVGALLAEAVPHFQMETARIGEAIYTGLYSAVAASVLTTALALAGEYYLRRMELHWRLLTKPFLSGLVAGLLAGALAGFMYGSAQMVEYWREILFRPVCWAALGGLLGWRLSSASPNLGVSRSIPGGVIGGAVGGFAFLFTALLFPQFIGRIIGFGVMGAALGLALVVADSLFRDAVLEVVWARNETTSIPLGERPVHIGGGDDHVSIAGLAEHAISITMEGGRIRYRDNSSGKKTDLKDGSRIKIGKVELVVHAKHAGKAPAKSEEDY